MPPPTPPAPSPSNGLDVPVCTGQDVRREQPRLPLLHPPAAAGAGTDLLAPAHGPQRVPGGLRQRQRGRQRPVVVWLVVQQPPGHGRRQLRHAAAAEHLQRRHGAPLEQVSSTTAALPSPSLPPKLMPCVPHPPPLYLSQDRHQRGRRRVVLLPRRQQRRPDAAAPSGGPAGAAAEGPRRLPRHRDREAAAHAAVLQPQRTHGAPPHSHYPPRSPSHL